MACPMLAVALSRRESSAVAIEPAKAEWDSLLSAKSQSNSPDEFEETANSEKRGRKAMQSFNCLNQLSADWQR